MGNPKLDPFQTLVNLCQRRVDKVPPGWFTIAQIRAKQDGTNDSWRAKLRRMEDAGAIDCKEFTIKALDGRVTRVKHYRPKENGNHSRFTGATENTDSSRG